MWQNEVGEPREGAHNGQRGGGSSTLPQKSNPVRSEAVLSLARHAAGLVGQLQLCAFHQHERDGVAWQLECLLLPQMLVATGAALRQSIALIPSLEIDRRRMHANLATTKPPAPAQSASFPLSIPPPPPAAPALVKDTCQTLP